MTSPVAIRQFPCSSCGAPLVWNPGVGSQVCTACGTTVAPPVGAVREIDFARSGLLGHDAAYEERLVVGCAGCGGETTFASNITAGRCAFCDATISAQATSRRLIKPQCLLPFLVTRPDANTAFGKWLSSRWFAPSALTRLARTDSDGLRGIYMPFWTYDARTTTSYSGERGDYYYVTETYTTQEDGKSVTRTREVRHTRWSSASGTVENAFDDLLVAASQSVPRAMVDKLEPWDLDAVVGYADEYLAGFQCESYQLNLQDGFEEARALMDPSTNATICSDIGGDEQRIDDRDISYRDVTFKHLLLPLWICSYRFGEKVFRFVVNARTGEVQGERPWSWVKIASLVIVVAAIVAAVAWWSSSQPT